MHQPPSEWLWSYAWPFEPEIVQVNQIKNGLVCQMKPRNCVTLSGCPRFSNCHAGCSLSFSPTWILVRKRSALALKMTFIITICYCRWSVIVSQTQAKLPQQYWLLCYPRWVDLASIAWGTKDWPLLCYFSLTKLFSVCELHISWTQECREPLATNIML